MTKPNKDGWIRHRGGRCPVEEGELVEVRCRAKITLDSVDSSWRWRHIGGPYDIMAYRRHHPETKEPTKMTAEQIQDQYKANIETIAALHKDQAALIQQLRELGFAFVGGAMEPEVDMSDYRNWKRGDLLEVVAQTMYDKVPVGSIVEHCDGDGAYAPFTKSVHHEFWAINAEKLKFHSRPAHK